MRAITACGESLFSEPASFTVSYLPASPQVSVEFAEGENCRIFVKWAESPVTSEEERIKEVYVSIQRKDGQYER